jgi:hypothetical protein
MDAVVKGRRSMKPIVTRPWPPKCSANALSATRRLGFLAVLLLVLLLGARLSDAAAAQPQNGTVYVVLWFDTEDYILPQSDAAALRITEILVRNGVRATFKVVGEKGRTLERRRRTAVIAALKRNEVGYHANTHSQHPTVAEYEAPLDWEQGAAEFTRRERPGFEDLRRIFGIPPTCYGQPGSSWAPQVFPALKSWGVKIYLDDARQVGLDGKPFWFGGLLNIFNIKAGSNLRPNDDWSNLDQVKANFRATYNDLLQSGGGVVSIYFHPCEFIHREFWDAVNFARGLNPPRDQWKVPPMKSPVEIERDFTFLDGLVAYMKAFPNVRFVTASEALAAMPDPAQGRAFSREDIADVAGGVTPEISFQSRSGYDLTASEAFELLNEYVAAEVKHRSPKPFRLSGTPYGPTHLSRELSESINVPWSQFCRTVIDVGNALDKEGQIPSPVWFGSTPVPPESYLVALAGVARELLAGHAPPARVRVPPACVEAARYVADDSPALWDWIIFPPGFDAPQLMALAKLQAWTLKSARLRAAPLPKRSLQN